MQKPVEARLIEIDKLDRNVSQPGAFYFVRRPGVTGVSGFIFGCPCGCGMRNLVYLKDGGNVNRPEHEVVSGAWPKVTLSPLITVKYDTFGEMRKDGAPHWRGALRDGFFVEERESSNHQQE